MIFNILYSTRGLVNMFWDYCNILKNNISQTLYDI